MKLIKDIVEEETGVPMLAFEVDLFDPRVITVEGVRAKLEEFFETIVIPKAKRSPKRVASVSFEKSKQKSSSIDTMPLTIDSTIGDLLANAKSKAIMNKHLPGMSTNPQMGMAKGMTLKAMAPMSGGKITPEMLKAIEEDLKKL